VIPNLPVVIRFCIAAIIGYAGLTIWVLIYGDAAMKGDTVGTWKSFAVAAFAMWLTRSMGKAQEEVDLDAARVANTAHLTALASKALDSPAPTDQTVPDVVLQPGETAQAAKGEE
jgi:hypothetical protein